jgi:pumilio homology domain family member 6
MSGVKRKADTGDGRASKKIKQKTSQQHATSKASKAKPAPKPMKPAADSDFSDSSSDFEGLSEENGGEASSLSGADYGEQEETPLQVKKSGAKNQKSVNQSNGGHNDPKAGGKDGFFPYLLTLQTLTLSLGNSSKESHAKQKVLAQERKFSKPNADSIARAKKIWERLRIKSSIPLEERKKLVAELFGVISGRVKDFVFKHDAVRSIQTAIRYASLEQRKVIARELKGDYRSLAESKYAKFLIGKLMVHGDAEIRDMIIPEFYGHVKRLIRHPEASWIVDDIYRTVATPKQKAVLLREWYGPEFALFKPNADATSTSELSEILDETPEKRGPIMRYLLELINQLIQKKTTGFTILHDAMLQYFLNTKPSSTESTDFLELLKGDEEGDLLKNLAFTKSGSKLVCLALAHGNAKDRKLILRTYKDTIRLLSEDPHGYKVLLAAYDVIDDTVMSSKAMFPELLGTPPQQEDLLIRLSSPTAHIPLLYLFSPSFPHTFPKETRSLFTTIRALRTETSKKDPHSRRRELLKSLAPTLLALIAAHPHDLLKSAFGAQAITDVLLCDCISDDKIAALTAVADLTTSELALADLQGASAGRMLKGLVQGGRYNAQTKTIDVLDPPLDFHNLLYERINGDIVAWATGPNSFVVVAMLEAGGFGEKEALLKTLRKSKKELQGAKGEGNKGAGLLLEMVS